MEAQKSEVTTEDTSQDSSETSGIDSPHLQDVPKVGLAESTATGGKLTGLFPDLNTVDWYLDPRFQRYWKHYHQVMNWYQKHIETYQMLTSRLNPGASTKKKSTKPSCSSSRFNPYASFHRSAMLQRTHGQQRDTFSRWTPPNSLNLHRCTESQNVTNKRAYDDTETTTTVDSSSACEVGENTKFDSCINPDEFEMEITDEMVEFFAQSQKHKKERDDAKKIITSDGQKVEAVYVDSEKVGQKTATTQPPKERPGLRRTQEMKLLYGKGAAMIHGMETAMQMTFDRNTDLFQPKPWPNMPLKISFS